jgi:PAS domain S-box-containing protein
MARRPGLIKVSPEQLLDWSEERFRLLVEGVVDYAIFILDPQGYVQTWNIGAERIKGYASHDIIGRHFSCFYESDAAERGWPAELLERARTLGRYEDEGWRVRKDGSRFWANVVLTALRSEDGTLRGFAKITRDLTERREHEEARRRLEILEEVSRRTIQFLALLGHELRNPLAPMRSALAVMNAVPVGDPRQITSRAVIDRQLDHLTRLVDELLDTGRVMTGRISLEPELLPVSRLVERAVEMVGPSMTARGHTLALQVQEDCVQGDELRLVQTLQSLLDNASKYTPEGGQLSLETGRRGDEIFLRLRDNGVGLSSELLPHVFEPFVQAERSLERSGGGLGLGLALAQKIAQLHGGRIVAESEGPQRGSTFTLWLPVVPGSAPDTPVPTPTPAPGPEASPGRARRVLVVDDNRDAADLLKLALELAGHEVQAAYDGLAALRLAEQEAFELILLDLGLPGLSGYEVAAHLRSQDKLPQPRLVALTGYGQEQDRRRSAEAGFDLHLVKPIDLGTLTELLAELP